MEKGNICVIFARGIPTFGAYLTIVRWIARHHTNTMTVDDFAVALADAALAPVPAARVIHYGCLCSW